MKKFLLRIFSVAGILIFFSAFYYLSKISVPKDKSQVNSRSTVPRLIENRLTSHDSAAKQFVRKNHFNSSLCLLIDMSIESGQDRFFVYDLSKDSVLDKGLVTHGRCKELWLTGRKYGNEVGCGCTSLGKYKIGYAYRGRFGLAYKLTGLDTSNNNAFKRHVVLHSHECVPDAEVYPYPICQSDGCPTVSKRFLEKLALIIEGSSQPILLWIYD